MTVRSTLGRSLALGVVAATVLGLAACGSDPAAGPTDLTQDADEDAALVVYSGRNEGLVGDLVARFEEATGVAVEVRYGDTAELAAQLQEEGGRTDADVFLAQDAGALGAVSDAGLVVELPAAVLERVPAAYRSTEGEWVGVTGRARVLAFDPDQVGAAQLPASVYDLVDPAWAGKVAVAPTNASFQSFVTAMRVVDGEEQAREFLEGLVANGVEKYPNNAPMVAAVDAGEVASALTNHYYRYELAAERGEAVTVQNHAFQAGDVGNLVNVSGAAVLAGTDKGASAVAFLEFLLGTEGQTYFAETNFEYPLVEGVPTAPGVPPLAALQPPAIDLSDLDSLAETQALLQEVGLL